MRPSIYGIKTKSVYVDSLETFLAIQVMGEEYMSAEWGDIYVDGEKLTNVVIPSTIASIGNYAFANSSVESVEIPSTCKSIGTYAFAQCYDLVDLEIADGVEELGDYAFWFTSLVDIVVPGSISEIGDAAFSLVETVVSIEIKEGVKRIGEGAFWTDGFDLTSVKLADSIEYIDDYAFHFTSGRCKATELILPASLKEIGVQAFTGWMYVEKIFVPASLTKVADHAFESLATQTEGWEIHVEDVESFWNIQFENGSSTISGWKPYAKFMCNGEEITRLVVPESVTVVNLNFTSGSYTEVVIHKGVTKIVDYAFTWSYLKTIYYEGTKEEWEAMDIGKFEYPWLTGIEIIYNSTGE